MADATITFTVNGQTRSVTTDPRRVLLEVLREDFGLTGTKFGCGEGQCGACTVLVDNKPTFSCHARVGDMAGKAIVTIEGLAKGQTLHPVQQAFLDEGAFQCGYCTSGMIMATVALLNEIPQPTETQIVTKLNRHICRCCGYPRIVKAVQRAATGVSGMAPGITTMPSGKSGGEAKR